MAPPDWTGIATGSRDMTLDLQASELLEPLLSLIRSGEFRKAVDSIGCYNSADMGRVVSEIGSGGS